MKTGAKILIGLLAAAILAGGIIYAVMFAGKPGAEQSAGTAASASAQGFVINEVMANNGGIFPDNNGSYSDWVELYNGTGAAINLSGYCLTDNETNLAKFALPSHTLEPGAYIVIFLSGDASMSEDGAPHGSFRLSSEGESIVMANAAGEILDKLEFGAMDTNVSYARKDGNWVETHEPTPGFPNTDEGYAQFTASRKVADSPIVVNEVMTGNKVTVPAPDGNYYDYIELVNRGAEAVDISGFGISDDPTDPLKYRLPDGVTIQPGGLLLVYCSGAVTDSTAEAIYAPFGLNSYEETVGVYDYVGKELDVTTVQELSADTCWCRVYNGDAPSDEWHATAKVTPGYPNTDAGYNEYLAKYSSSLGSITLGEVLPGNNSIDFEGNGITYDFLEVVNTGGTPADISGYGLTTNTKNPAMWRFPDGTVLSPGERKVVLAQGSDTDVPENATYLHTNFGISKGGEILALFDADGSVLDVMRLSTLPAGISVAREGTGFKYYTEAKPGEAKSGGYDGFTSAPAFSQTPGVYDGSVSVELLGDSGATIYYTTDCTTPTTSSQVYSGAITLSQNTVIRAVAVHDGYITGATVSGTFLFKSDDVNHSLRIVSLVTDPANLWDPETGIYTYGSGFDPVGAGGNGEDDEWPYDTSNANFWQEWDRPVSLEYFNELGKEVFWSNAGMRISGAFGQGRNQKAMSIIAQDQYGSNRLTYPFFDELPYTEYKAVTFRSGAQDQTNSKIRDELSARVLRGSDINFLYQEYEPVVMYLNGEYWGVYFMKEKRNRFMVAQHENIEPTGLDLIKSTTQVYYGDSDDWASLMQYIGTHDLAVQENYDYVASQVDIDSFTDYQICETYVGNSDYWNIQYYKVNGGKWKWIYYDFCWSWGNTEGGVNHPTLARRRDSSKPCSDLFNALLKNSGYRDKFARRFAQLLDTVYEPAHVLECVDELYTAVEPEITREREKFNTGAFDGRDEAKNHATYDGFIANIEQIKRFAQERPAAIKSQIQTELGLSDAYMQEVFG